MSQIPLAYKYVFIAVMTSQVNYYAPRLHLPIAVPVKEQDVRYCGVTPPTIDGKLLYGAIGGRIQINNYSFAFSDRLARVTKLEDDGKDSFGIPLLELNERQQSLMERASRMKYTVNTNDLYQMATNYLIALNISRQSFETTNILTIEQGLFHSIRGLVPNPLIYAYWGRPELRGPHFNGFSFRVSAVSGELLELNVGNTLNSPMIKDVDKLLAISDAEFIEYSAEQRSNLVARFSAVPYPASTNEPPNLLSQTNTPADTNAFGQP